MNDRIIFHPILFSFLPILFLFQYNIHEVPITDVILPLFLSVIPILVVWIPLKFLIGFKKSSLITSTLVILFVLYANLHHLLTTQSNSFLQTFGKNSVLGVIFFIIAIIIIVLILKRKSIKNINNPLNIMSITIIGFLLVSISGYYVSNPVDYSISDYSQLEIPIFDTKIKPDIYMFIFDEFSGKDTLRIDFDYDLQPFEDKLTERGFVTPQQSFSNYPNTELAMPSLLNMIYLDFLKDQLGVDSNDFRLPLKMLESNTVMKIFKANDYNITRFNGGIGLVPDVRLTYEILCNYGIINPDLLKNFVLTYMPFSYFNKTLLENHQYEKLECFFDTIANKNFEKTSPNFVHAHLRLPHEPFIYDEFGNITSQKNQNDKVAYLSQLKFTEKRILELIDIIQERSPDSIILVMSDHGYRSEIDWENAKSIDHLRAFNTILSFYFPNSDVEIPSEVSSVNIFRILFNSNFNTEFEILENRYIWYIPGKPYDFIKVPNSFKDL